MTAAIAVGLALWVCPEAVSPRVYLNASPSVPRGLYAITFEPRYARGDLVLAALPPGAAWLADRRGYLGSGIPVLKRVSGLRGDSVCRDGLAISINGRIVAMAMIADARGRGLPVWSGCLSLQHDDVFLLGDSSDSFDGRYFGPLKRKQIIGKAARIW
ncbi:MULTISPECIES: S26 family signal peptidase [Rhodomicrobium]|uniref:S26 family signal peptidase n=1 Tax=Rhodomicrobium TaxID=1068 RepID=UPI000B4ABEFD|nr:MULTISPECIES: S26 family signal peptidase [Rhodomicrobium]